jgi:hypothetical protein
MHIRSGTAASAISQDGPSRSIVSAAWRKRAAYVQTRGHVRGRAACVFDSLTAVTVVIEARVEAGSIEQRKRD